MKKTAIILALALSAALVSSCRFFAVSDSANIKFNVGEKVEAPGKRSEARVVTFAPCADRRSVRTRRALRSALAQEVDATGDLSRVTVTAVTDSYIEIRRTAV